MAARLRDDDPSMHEQAVAALRAVEHDLVPNLAWGLENLKSARGRNDVVELLKGLGNPASLTVLRLLQRALGDPDTGVKRAAFMAMFSPVVVAEGAEPFCGPVTAEAAWQPVATPGGIDSGPRAAPRHTA
jgi:hypothetical protein